MQPIEPPVAPDGPVNLDAEKPGKPADPPPPATPPPGATEKPFDPSPARENVRGLIAKWLVLLLAAIVTAPFWFIAWRSNQATAVKEILQIVLGPVVALVGSATGYYFGVERSAVASSGIATATTPKTVSPPKS